MFPCCELCYEKYIAKDGVLDKERLNTAVKGYCKANGVSYRGDVASRLVSEPCVCECHKDGVAVLH